MKVTLPHAVSDYLLNQKRDAISKLEMMYGLAIHVFGNPDMAWHDLKIDVIPKAKESLPAVNVGPQKTDVEQRQETEEKSAAVEEGKTADAAETSESRKKRLRRRSRHHKRHKSEKMETAEKSIAPEPAELPEFQLEMLSDTPSQQIPSRQTASAKHTGRKRRSSHRRSAKSARSTTVSDETVPAEEGEDEVSLFRWY
jgi:hypothetical protein